MSGIADISAHPSPIVAQGPRSIDVHIHPSLVQCTFASVALIATMALPRAETDTRNDFKMAAEPGDDPWQISDPWLKHGGEDVSGHAKDGEGKSGIYDAEWDDRKGKYMGTKLPRRS